MAKMTIDELRYRALFEKPNRQPDGRGGWKVAGYVPAIPNPIWTALKPQSKQQDHEKEHVQQQQVRMTFLLTVRFRTDITSEMRAIIDGRKLYIVKTPYDPDGRRRWLSMEVEERND